MLEKTVFQKKTNFIQAHQQNTISYLMADADKFEQFLMSFGGCGLP